MDNNEIMQSWRLGMVGRQRRRRAISIQHSNCSMDIWGNRSIWSLTNFFSLSLALGSFTPLSGKSIFNIYKTW